MAKEAGKDTIQQQGTQYIRLGKLLAKKRDASVQEQVSAIVNGSLTLEEKISRIEAIDAETSGPERLKIYVMDSGNVLRQSGPSAQLVKIRKNRTALRRDIPPVGWFAYLFRERLRLTGSRRCEPFLRYGLLSLRFERDAIGQLQARLRGVSLPVLQQAVDLVLRDGWRFLTKAEYNLAAALSALLHEIKRGSFSVELAAYRSPATFWSLESAWLFFLTAPDYSRRTAQVLERMMELDPALASRKAEVVQLLAELLAVRTAGVNLSSFVLALNIFRSRKLLAIEDLVDSSHGPYLAAEDYDCTEDVRVAINEEIDQTCRRLGEVNKKINEITRLRNFLPLDSAGDPVYSELYIAAGLPSGPAPDGATDAVNAKMTDNTLNFVSHLCGTFLRSAEPMYRKFLRRAEQVQSGAAARNNPDYEAAKLLGLRDKLDALMATLPHLPRARFVSLKNTGQNPSKYEVEALSLLTEASELFLRYGQKMANLLAEIPPPEVSSEGAESPHGAAGLGVDPVPDGKLLEALAERDHMINLIRSAYLAAAWLQNREITEALEQEQLFAQERKSLARKLERLCNRSQFLFLDEQLRLSEYLR